MDTLLIILYIFINFISIYLSYRYFDKNGLFTLSILFFMVSFLTLNQLIKFNVITYNIAIISFVSFTAIEYIFIVKETKKENKKYLFNYIIFNIIFIISLILTLLYNHSINDTFSKNFLLTFFENKLIFILFPFINIISIILTYKIFEYIQKKENIFFNKIIITTIIVGIIDTILYFTIGNILDIGFIGSLRIALGNYLIKILLTILFIPLIYTITDKRKRISWI